MVYTDNMKYYDLQHNEIVDEKHIYNLYVRLCKNGGRETFPILKTYETFKNTGFKSTKLKGIEVDIVNKCLKHIYNNFSDEDFNEMYEHENYSISIIEECVSNEMESYFSYEIIDSARNHLFYDGVTPLYDEIDFLTDSIINIMF